MAHSVRKITIFNCSAAWIPFDYIQKWPIFRKKKKSFYSMTLIIKSYARIRHKHTSLRIFTISSQIKQSMKYYSGGDIIFVHHLRTTRVYISHALLCGVSWADCGTSRCHHIVRCVRFYRRLAAVVVVVVPSNINWLTQTPNKNYPSGS